MAIDRPKKKHWQVEQKERFDYLWKQSKAGHPLFVGLADRRKRYQKFSLKFLDPAYSKPCYVCDHRAEHWHHIVYLSRGGADSFENLVPLCLPCHRKVHRKDKVRGNRKKPKKLPSPFIKPTVDFVYVPPIAA